ncbi:MAG: hypothetical protein IT179_17275 [Acidobacteria bacterium]|nr:hypothetical protein [Acidobacteriota bacterium]
MSSRARRLAHPSEVRPYDWNGTAPAPRAASPAPIVVAPPVIDAAQVEREAFMKGYAQGERAGAEAAAARGDAVVRRLADTVDEIRTLRTDLLQKAERQIVQLALAIARRIVHREVSIDRDLVAAMGRVALDRLGQTASATIRLHPDDYAAVVRDSAAAASGDGTTTIVADPMVRRGGCLVRSDFGVIDVGIDAQIQEIATALLGSHDGDVPPGAEALGGR